MKNYTYILIALWLSVSNCLAQVKPVDKLGPWLAEFQKQHPKVVGASVENGAITKLDFSGDSTKAERDAANAAKSSFTGYTPPPKADYDAFKNSILESKVIPPEVIDQLALYFPLLDYVEAGKSTADKMQARWASIKKALGPELSAVVEGYAAAAHVPLVP